MQISAHSAVDDQIFGQDIDEIGALQSRWNSQLFDAAPEAGRDPQQHAIHRIFMDYPPAGLREQIAAEGWAKPAV